MHTVSYHTLGCKLNFAETSVIGKELTERGFVRAGVGEHPDLCVVNTCSVTAVADKKARSLIRRLHSRHPEASIVVTGCYAQLKPDEVAALPGVEIVLGSNEKLRLVEYLEAWLQDRKPLQAVTATKDIREFHHSCERGDRTRYYLKVQDGCDYWCTYCTIPMARGRSRSPLISELVAEAEAVAAQGGKEIILTGVNIGDFGKGREESFFDLIRALDRVEGIERYRISSIEPNLLTPEIIRWVGQEARAFMPHFHIPLQSGSDAVLRLMHRHYDTALFAERVALVRELVPDAFIGVDIMAGTRGETEEEWQRGLAFVKDLPVQQLHVFPYSERPGTKALEIGVPVPQAEKHRRVAQLIAVSGRKYEVFRKAAEGTVRPVLWEGTHEAGAPAPAVMHGYTDNYIRVEAPYDAALIGEITPVRLGAAIDEETMGCTLL